MSATAAPHEQAEQPFVGAPIKLPRILLCHATPRFCGRHWVANTWTQLADLVEQRKTHEALCANVTRLAGLI
jgi:ADP-heptose:LPS heptosyltransferase